MIAICRDCKHLVSKAADILLQLFQTDQPSEVTLINHSLTTLLNLDIKKFLQSFFTNFEEGSEIVRERSLKFLASKINGLPDGIMTKEVEELLLTHSKKAMEDVTKDEFLTFIGILSKLKIAKTATGQAMIVLVIKGQADLANDFNPNEIETLDKFLLCTKHTIPFLSQYNPASEYINYICTKLLPHLSALEPSGNDLKILQVLAEMSPHVYAEDLAKGQIDFEKCQQTVFEMLVQYLPLPQLDAPEVVSSEGESKQAEEKQGDIAKLEDPKTDTVKTDLVTKVSDDKGSLEFKFTHIEYLLFTFHQFGRLKSEFFTESLQNDIKLRLQHLALGCSKYSDLLSAVKPGDDNKKEDSQIRSVALRTTKNISTLVRDLFRKPPSFKSIVLLSCKPLTPKTNEAPSQEAAASRAYQNSGGASYRQNTNQRQGGYNKNNQNGNSRQPGQKSKYRHNYQDNRRGNKRRYVE